MSILIGLPFTDADACATDVPHPKRTLKVPSTPRNTKKKKKKKTPTSTKQKKRVGTRLNSRYFNPFTFLRTNKLEFVWYNVCSTTVEGLASTSDRSDRS